MKKTAFSEEQIDRILQEAASGQKTQAQLCRDHGVSTNTFYLWKRKYVGFQTEYRSSFDNGGIVVLETYSLGKL
jgi:putative transposase